MLLVAFEQVDSTLSRLPTVLAYSTEISDELHDVLIDELLMISVPVDDNAGHSLELNLLVYRIMRERIASRGVEIFAGAMKYESSR